MPIFKAIKSGKTVASLHQVLYYTSRKDKKDEEQVLKTGLGCSSKVDIAFKEMMFNKRHYNKANGKMYKHYAQSFEPNTITKEKAHEIGVKFAEENFLNKGFRAYVVTHIDKDHIHNHIIIDNVSFETGLKYVELDEKDLKKKQYKDRELKAHENTLENLKKSSDEIAYYYGIDIVKKEGKSINIYDKNKYKAIERGFIGNVAKEWNEILFDETTNLSNFQQVLEEKGIFTKVDEEFKQIYFTNNKANFNKRHSKKVLSLYKIASVFDYQFKNADEVNIFDYDKSLQLLNKSKEKESELELEENTLIAGDKDKKEPIKEIEKEIKKDFLAVETDNLKENIEKYNSNVNSRIDSFLEPLENREITLNVGLSVSSGLKDFNTLKREVNTRIANTKLSIAKENAETIFKNTLNKWSKENIRKDKIIEKILGTRDIVDKKIKDTLKDMPRLDNIKNIDELKEVTKLVEDTKKENLEKLDRIGKKHFFTDIKEKINNFIEKVIDFNHNYMDKHIPKEKERFAELEKTLVAEYRASTEQKDRGRDINSLYNLEDYIKESTEEKERERQRTIEEDRLLREKKKKTTTTTTTVTEVVEEKIDITNITDNIEDIEKTREIEKNLKEYVENKKKENHKKNDKAYITEDKEKEKEQEMEC